MVRAVGGCVGAPGLRRAAIAWISSAAHLECGALVERALAPPAGHCARVRRPPSVPQRAQ